MYTLLATVFGIACVLRIGQACIYCHPNLYELSDAYCHPFKSGFLIQAEVVAESGPLLEPFGLATKTEEEEKKRLMAELGIMRYTMAVKEVYRFDGANINQTITFEAYTNPGYCGALLKLGKTYVISGYFYTVDGKNVFKTSACWYIREYDSEVDIVLQECPDQYKLTKGHGGSANAMKRASVLSQSVAAIYRT